MKLEEIPINSVKIIDNVRTSIKDLEQMMQDIKQNGLYNPIKVMEVKKSNEYILVQGHRRLSACQKLGWKKIPATIVDEMEVADLLISNMAENIHRKDIEPFEVGRICDRLKKMGLNIPEIHAKLSYPISKINQALDIFYQLPDKYRTKISYVGQQAKDGNIPATVAHKIISCKRQYGLSEIAVEKLFHETKMQELTIQELSLVGQFLSHGLSVTQSLEKMKHFKPTRTDIIVDIEEMEKIMKKYKMDSAVMTLQHIVYGDIPPPKETGFLGN